MSNTVELKTAPRKHGAAEKKRIEARFARYINRSQINYLRAGHLDVMETERCGVRFTDAFSGRVMYDCFTSAGCFNVSRHRPEMMAALDEALQQYDMGSSGLLSRPKIAFAEKLVSMTPGDLDGVLFAAGGGDAVDCAIKLARGASKRSEIVSTIKAYHGHTGFALSANGKEHYRKYFEPLMPGFQFVPFNDIEAMRAKITEHTAAVLLEPVQGEAGIFPAEKAYLQEVRRICDEKGALLIFDEIQTGFGRTGKLFACQHSGVIPDIMTLAKSIGGALYPNGAVVYRRTPALLDFINTYPEFHPSPSGGSDIAACVSLKALEIIERDRLWENAERMGQKLRAALEQLKQDMPRVIKEVRSLGLMVGIEYLHEFLGPMMSDALAKRGVFAVYSGNAPQVMRFMPPITVNEHEMDEIITAVRAAVADMKRILPVALVAARVPGVLPLLNDERVQTVVFNFLRRFENLGKRAEKK